MRVCDAHKAKAVTTLKNNRDDSEYDLCEVCMEAFQLIVSGVFFQPEEKPGKRVRPPKAGE